MRHIALTMSLILGSAIGPSWAEDTPALTALERGEYGALDNYPGNPLYNAPIQVSEHVYSAIGATQPETFENHGHNNNLTFIIGEQAIMVVNGGSNEDLAAALHEHIKTISDLPVKYVVSENGQRHAMLGNAYWRRNGAESIAHVDAAEEVEHFAGDYIEATRRQRQDENYPVNIEPFDREIDGPSEIDLGNLVVQIKAYGPAHSPGDISVLVPADNLVIAGDLAFHVRMPPIFDETDTAGWVETWDVFSEEAGDMLILPGHGGPTDMATVTEGTYDYLMFLRGEVQALIDEGGSLDEAYKIDQSPYRHWHTFEELAARNAGRVFTAMEFE